MIEMASYWMGRDKLYPADFTPDIQRRGLETVSRGNRLLDMYFLQTGVVLTKLSSGWRPRKMNDATSNAGKNSNHITAGAEDVADDDRSFAAWCVLNKDALAKCELWMEDPRWTPTWVHLQTIPPGSGNRIYIPAMTPPKAPPLPGQKPLPFVRKI